MTQTRTLPAFSRFLGVGKFPFIIFYRGGLVFYLLSLVWLNSSCRVSLIADRDEVFVNRVYETARTVDALYLHLMSADSTQLQYIPFVNYWNEAELQIRQLKLMAEAHPLNSESSKICSQLLETFLKYKTQHKINNFYLPALLPLHRDRLSEYFLALLSIEKAKENAKP
ncbi:MAG: hypothetical protein ACP5O2_09380 [Bacteroidales bacterium]